MKDIDLVKEKLTSLFKNEKLENYFSNFSILFIIIFLISLFSITIELSNINRDGLLYLKQAHLFNEGKWNEAISLHPLPLFSYLISLVSLIFKIDLIYSAYLLNLFLFSLVIYYFLRLLSLTCSDRKILFFGSILFLSFQPIFDSYIGMIIRDHGFWAGCISGIYYLLKYMQIRSIKYIAFSQISFFIASLFRFEAIIFFIFSPIIIFYVFFDFNKCHKSLKSNSLFLICIFISLGIFLYLINYFLDISFFIKKFTLFTSRFLSPMPIHTNKYFLSELIKDNGIYITHIVLLGIFLKKLIVGFGFFHNLILLYALHNNYFWRNKETKTLLAILFISLVIVLSNLYSSYVLASRYFIFSWLIVIVVIAPAFLPIYKKYINNLLNKFIFYLLVLLLIFNSLIDSNKSNKHFDLIKKEFKVLNIQPDEILFYDVDERLKLFIYRDISLHFNNEEFDRQNWVISSNKNISKFDMYNIQKEFFIKKEKFLLLKIKY